MAPLLPAPGSSTCRSAGRPPMRTLRAAVNRATAAGVIIVISAGNDFDTDPVLAANPDALAQIANDVAVSRNLVLIAGALTSTNANLTAFSNRAGNGASHYLGALGSFVRTIDETGAAVQASGTSFAAPIVAGGRGTACPGFPGADSVADRRFDQAQRDRSGRGWHRHDLRQWRARYCPRLCTAGRHVARRIFGAGLGRAIGHDIHRDGRWRPGRGDGSRHSRRLCAAFRRELGRNRRPRPIAGKARARAGYRHPEPRRQQRRDSRHAFSYVSG